MSALSHNKFEHVYSKRGKRLILMSNFFFYKDRVLSTGIKWRCIKKLCTAKLYTDSLEKEILNYHPHHNHEPSNTISRQIISNAIKKKALENLTVQPSRIIEETLSSSQYSGEINELDRSYIQKNMRRVLLNSKRKGGKSDSSERTTKNQTDEVEMECSENAEMETQSSASTSLLNNSDIVIKQEIIETELESSMFDNSSVADTSSEMHYGRQTPSASYVLHSESSNSKEDSLPYILTTAPTLLKTVKVESDVSTGSCDESSVNNDTFFNPPSLLSVSNATNFETSSKYAPIPPNLHPILSISSLVSSLNSEPIKTTLSSRLGSPTLPQVLDSTSHGSSCNNESIQPEVLPNSSPPFPPKDRFDDFGAFIASKLRNMDSKSSSFIQSAFADLIYKAELGILLNKCESYTSATLTDDARKNEPPANITNSSLENGNTQHKVSSDAADQSLPPNNINSVDKNTFINEPLQHIITSHTANPRLPVFNVSESEIASKTNPHQSEVSGVGLPLSHPVLNPPASSWCKLPSQPRVPFHLRPRDEFDVYGEFAASKLRVLDSRSCAFLQIAFADLVFEAELGRYLSEGEKSIFAKKTNDILQNMPPLNDSGKCI